MAGIGVLLCGELKINGIAKSALEQLSTSIDDFSNRSMSFYKADPSSETASFGPFCARVLLENGCAALVGRLDAFRLLYLSEFQSQPQYEIGKRARSSFSWTGDVMPESETPEMWSLNNDVPKISRALFSRHADHVFWRPAIDRMLDFAVQRPAREVPADLLTIDSDVYISSVRGRTSQLYSTLSKGVHWEFFTSALLFDEATIKSLIRDTCILMAQLGLISHFIPTACSSLAPVKALKLYRKFRKEMP